EPVEFSEAKKRAGWSHHSPPNGGSAEHYATLMPKGPPPGTSHAKTARTTEHDEVVMRTQATIRTLNKLIRTCRDTEELCGVCGDSVESPGLRSLLRYRSEEWGRQGDELQALVLLLGGYPARAAGLHAHLAGAWLAFKTALLGPSDLAAIEVWQRI